MVKQGYKQTEVGIIPEDWKVSTMESITSLMTNGFVGTIKSEYVPSGTGILYLQGFNIKENGFDLTGVTYVSDSFHKKHLKSELKENDLLTVQTGDIGVTSYLPKQFEGANCQALIISRFYDKYDSRFWSYYFNSTGRKTLKLIETGTTMKHINVGDMKGVLVPVPTTKEEQKRIAEALSDVDSMISSLEKLIAKKKAVKQGAMQELLTGKKRLPGFTGEWNTFIFGELFDFIPNNAFTRAQMSDSGKVKNIHYGDILTIFGSCIDGDSNSIPYINQDIDLTRFADRCYLQSGDIIIADTAEDETVGKALEVDNVNSPVLAGQHTLLCRSKIKFADKFLGYYLNAACYHDQLLPFIVGTKVSSVSKSSVSQTKLVVPDFEEQTAIASIFLDMDNEIEALEQKLEKTCQIKQGMMQQLLTGKIRLV